MAFRGRSSPWWRRNLYRRGRFQYELAEIEGALEASEPRLASMFAEFTTLQMIRPCVAVATAAASAAGSPAHYPSGSPARGRACAAYSTRR
jgi:hypothetical protein